MEYNGSSFSFLVYRWTNSWMDDEMVDFKNMKRSEASERIKVILRELDGLLGTGELNDWEEQFVRSNCERLIKAEENEWSFMLSEKQVEVIDKIYEEQLDEDNISEETIATIKSLSSK